MFDRIQNWTDSSLDTLIVSDIALTVLEQCPCRNPYRTHFIPEWYGYSRLLVITMLHRTKDINIFSHSSSVSR